MNSSNRNTIFGIMLIAMTVTSFTRNFVWQNECTLWSDVAAKSPQKAAPHVNLGNAFLRRGFLDIAEQEFNSALAVNSVDTRALNGLAVIHFKRKQYDEAIRLFEILAEDKPGNASFHSNLGVLYMEKGLLDKAIRRFRKAIEVNWAFTDAHSNLGIAYTKKKMLEDAHREFNIALELQPDHRNAKRNLDQVLKLINGTSLRY